MEKFIVLPIAGAGLFAAVFIILLFQAPFANPPTVYVRVSSVTCLQDRTGMAVVLNTSSDRMAEFTIYRVEAISKNRTISDVEVFILTEDGRIRIGLPYKITIEPGEEVVLGFLAHAPGVDMFIVTVDCNRSVMLATNCTG